MCVKVYRKGTDSKWGICQHLTNKWNITVLIILHTGGIEFSAEFSIAEFSTIDAVGRGVGETEPPPDMGSGIFQNVLPESDFCSFVATCILSTGTIDAAGRGGRGGGGAAAPPTWAPKKFKMCFMNPFLFLCGYMYPVHGVRVSYHTPPTLPGTRMHHDTPPPRPDGTIKIRPGPDCSRPISAIVPISKRHIRAPYLLSAQAAVPCGAS